MVTWMTTCHRNLMDHKSQIELWNIWVYLVFTMGHLCLHTLHVPLHQPLHHSSYVDLSEGGGVKPTYATMTKERGHHSHTVLTA